MTITAPELEIAVLVLGMAILLVEAFVTKIDKRTLAFVAIAGLTLVLVASFFVAPSASTGQATGFWSFYTADRLSIAVHFLVLHCRQVSANFSHCPFSHALG
jgi:NADH:ubiquinone oxidoreductase subunit 2 (subunit N)